MSLNNPYQTYQRQAVTTSKPEELTFMLYQGLVKFIRLSKKALENQNIPEAHNFNLRAQDILVELIVTLKDGYSVSGPLSSLYDYMKRRLIEGNMRKDLSILAEVEGFAVELMETWSSAMKQTNNK